MGRIIGIDFGAKRTGIATTDPLRIIASALTTVESETVIEFLKKYVASEVVDEFVVGLPLNLNNQETDGTALVRAFLIQLEAVFPDKKIATHDERFTSKMALQTMILGGSSKKDRKVKGNLDKISAQIILQEYMEKRF